MKTARVVVDSRVRVFLPDVGADVAKEIAARFEHENPKHKQLKRLRVRFDHRKEPKTIATWRRDGAWLSVPRGGMPRVRDALAGAGFEMRVRDDRSDGYAPICDGFDWPAHKRTLFPDQEEALAEILRRETCYLRSPTGCLSGETLVTVNRAGIGRKMRLSHVVRMFNGGAAGGKTWRADIPTFVRAPFPGGRVQLARLLGARESGVKDVYCLRLEPWRRGVAGRGTKTQFAGARVVATSDHRFLTPFGWRALADLSAGDDVLADAGMGGKGSRTKPWYQLRTLREHPFAGRKGVRPGKGGWSVPLHRLVAEARENGVELEEFIERVKNRDSSLRFLDPKVWVVHHVDGNPRNNAPENLEVVTHEEHRARHRGDALANIASRLVAVRIASIEYAGEIPTFDLEVERASAFIANGVAVHNSGKSTIGIAAIARARVPSIVIVWTGALFDQWVERIEDELGIDRANIGMVRGSKKTVGPITVAMQQSLARMPPDAPFFRFPGFVLADECFIGDSCVLMEDGSLKRMSDVVEGERVAVGGRVLSTMRRDYEGEVTRIGDAWATRDHPIATRRGWVRAELIRGDDVLWYDPIHELRPVRIETAETQPNGCVQEARQFELRCGDGRVPTMWEGSTAEGTGASREHEMRHARRVERGEDGQDGSSVARLRREASRTMSAVDGSQDEAGVEGPVSSRALGRRDFEGAASEIRERRGACREREAHASIDPGREDRRFRWQAAREREAADARRAESVLASEVARVSAEPRGADGSAASFSLQDRSGASGGEDRSGVGWQQSHESAKRRAGREERLFPEVARLAGASLPGTVRLEAHVFRSGGVARRVSESVYNLETEVGVYVAGGVLVHNCQRFSAPTFVACVDPFLARYRIGMSADERRADRKEFLAHDLFGDLALEISRAELVEKGRVRDVEVLVVPTGWELSPAAQSASLLERNRLMLDEMAVAGDRDALVVDIVREELERNEQILVFSLRVEHCRRLVGALNTAGVSAGLMIGGVENSVELEDAVKGMRSGRMRVAVGTVQAVGTGVDLPRVGVGVATMPVAGNHQLFGQVAGRLSRIAGGTEPARLYYLLDECRRKDWSSLFDDGRPVSVRAANGQWIDARADRRRAKSVALPDRGIFAGYGGDDRWRTR